MSDIDNEMDTRLETTGGEIPVKEKKPTENITTNKDLENRESQDTYDSHAPKESSNIKDEGLVDKSIDEIPSQQEDKLERKNSFLDKYLSESEPEGGKSDEDKQKEKQVERKPVKKKVQKKTNKTSNEKILNQRQRSMRWKDIRLVVGDDSDEEEKEVIKPPQLKVKQIRKERQNIHRRSTVHRIQTEQAESSTESEEEDDRVLDGKVSVADLPSEYWQIQRLVKFLKIGNQVATVITLCGLTDFNLTQEMIQMAIRDVNGLTILVNILRTDHVTCQVGALKVLQQLTLNSKYNRRAVINMGGVQILVNLITDCPQEVQSLAAANLANMAKSSLGRNILKRHGGLQKLVGLLDYEDGRTRSTGRRSSDNQPPSHHGSDLEVARNAALALWSCSKSTRSRSAIFKAGSVPLLAKLIRLDKEEFLVPIVGLAQECAVESRFREAFYKESIITAIVQRLVIDNEELQGYCANAIFKCAVDEQTRKAVYDCGGLDTLVSLLSRQDNKKLLAAVTGAIWKCAISEYNVRRLMEVKALETLIRLLQGDEDGDELPEQVQLHIVGAIGEIAKDPKGPLEVLRCKGCKTLVDILNIPNEELTGTVARAIAACAVNSSCRAVFNRLEGLRLLWSLMKSRNNKVVAGAAWAVYRLMQDTPEAWETARSFVGGLDLTVRLLKSDDLEVLTSACAVISTVACDPENLGVITDYEVVSHLANLTHKTDVLLRRHLAEAIAMCSKWGNNAKRFSEEGAVKPMVEYLGSHDITVQRSAMRALEQLGKYPDSCITMHRSGVVKVMLPSSRH